MILRDPCQINLILRLDPNMNSSFLLNDLKIKKSASINFESWMSQLDQEWLSSQDQALWLKALEEHPEWVNQRGGCQRTPLMIAALSGHLEIARALIEAKAELNDQDQWGWTVLMQVSNQGGLDMVKMLLQAEAEVNVQNNKGWTSLMLAAEQGHQEVINRLIQAGSDLNQQDQKGWTVLMYASYWGLLELVQELISHGADREICNNDHEKAWDLAKKNGNHEVMSLLDACADHKTLIQAVKPLETALSSESFKGTDSRWASKGLRL